MSRKREIIEKCHFLTLLFFLSSCFYPFPLQSTQNIRMKMNYSSHKWFFWQMCLQIYPSTFCIRTIWEANGWEHKRTQSQRLFGRLRLRNRTEVNDVGSPRYQDDDDRLCIYALWNWIFIRQIEIYDGWSTLFSFLRRINAGNYILLAQILTFSIYLVALCAMLSSSFSLSH